LLLWVLVFLALVEVARVLVSGSLICFVVYEISNLHNMFPGFLLSLHFILVMQYESQTRGLMQELLNLELLLVYNAWPPESDNPIDEFFARCTPKHVKRYNNSQHDNPTSKVDSCSLLCCLLLICNFHSILFFLLCLCSIILVLHILLAAVVIQGASGAGRSRALQSERGAFRGLHGTPKGRRYNLMKKYPHDRRWCFIWIHLAIYLGWFWIVLIVFVATVV